MIRSIRRQIAKDRMKDMGYDHVNSRLGTADGHRMNKRIYRKLMKTRQGRARWFKAAGEVLPLWRRVTQGEQANKAASIQAEKGAKRYFMKHGEWPKDYKGPKRVIRRVEAAR